MGAIWNNRPIMSNFYKFYICMKIIYVPIFIKISLINVTLLTFLWWLCFVGPRLWEYICMGSMRNNFMSSFDRLYVCINIITCGNCHQDIFKNATLMLLDPHFGSTFLWGLFEIFDRSYSILISFICAWK